MMYVAEQSLLSNHMVYLAVSGADDYSLILLLLIICGQ